ncbi:hypothetical protein Dimus_025524, partial [Dionaea muscipula]
APSAIVVRWSTDRSTTSRLPLSFSHHCRRPLAVTFPRIAFRFIVAAALHHRPTPTSLAVQIEIRRRLLAPPTQAISTSTRFVFDFDIDFIIFSFFILYRPDPLSFLVQED